MNSWKRNKNISMLIIILCRKQQQQQQNYWPNVSTKSLFLCLMTSRDENLLTMRTSETGTLSEPRSTHHQLGLSSCVCAHWAPGSKFVATFPSTAFQELPPQQVPLCSVRFPKAKFSTQFIYYADKAQINMFFEWNMSLHLDLFQSWLVTSVKQHQDCFRPPKDSRP